MFIDITLLVTPEINEVDTETKNDFIPDPWVRISA
jgi:hypothetical protein